MPVAAYTLPVNAPVEIIWGMLEESAAIPQRYDGSVDSVRVIDDDETGILREVSRGGIARRERVVLDSRQRSLTATLVDDSEYTGTVVLRAEAANPASSGHGHARISGRMDWQSAAGPDEPAVAEALASALQAQLAGLKHAAEARAVMVSAA